MKRRWETNQGYAVSAIICVLQPKIFIPRCNPSADMPFLLVQIQNLPCLHIQGVIILLQPMGKILMYGGLGNTEMPGGRPHGGTGLDHVHSQFTGPLLKRIFHGRTSDAVC